MLNEIRPIDLGNSNSIAQLEAAASEFAKSIGCRHFSYVMGRRPQANVADKYPVFLSSYPAEWRAHYLSRSYQFYDPVVILSKRNRLPYFWGQRGFLRHYNKAERYVFHEAAEFGILEGYSIPVVGPEFDSGVFSVVADARKDIPAIVNQRIGELQIFATKFHDAAVKVSQMSMSSATNCLTAREREVLTWTAEGYSSEAVAARLGLSASAINYHITNCCRKLGACNKIQAVALAIRQRLM